MIKTVVFSMITFLLISLTSCSLNKAKDRINDAEKENYSIADKEEHISIGEEEHSIADKEELNSIYEEENSSTDEEGYNIKFIDYDMTYEIDIANDGIMDHVSVIVDEDRYAYLILNEEKKYVCYSASWVESVLISDNEGNYCIGIAENGDNDIMGTIFYDLKKDGIAYKKSLGGHIDKEYKNQGLYVEDRRYIIGFQTTTDLYLINPDLSLSSGERNCTISTSGNTLVKNMTAYKYNKETGKYEMSTYKAGEVIYVYETDKKNFIYFRTEDNEKGYIYVIKPEEDYEFYIGDERLVDYFDKEEISWAG